MCLQDNVKSKKDKDGNNERLRRSLKDGKFNCDANSVLLYQNICFNTRCSNIYIKHKAHG